MAGMSRFDYLVKQHSRRVYTYAISMTRNVSDAEDITQEVLIRTWQNLDSFRFWSAKTWMMRTTHNLCIDWLRRRRNQLDRELRIDQSPRDEIPALSREYDPVETVVRVTTMEHITHALDHLPERLRGPFVLYEIQGFKYREIETILGMPINTVKVNILRARKELQKRLSNHARDDA
jgi:RNA polymerase sigma-70 factor (ECF subfamily)